MTDVPTVPVEGPVTVTAGGVEEMDTVASLKAFAPLKSVTVALIVLDPFDEYDTVKLVPVPVEGVPPGADQLNV